MPYGEVNVDLVGPNGGQGEVARIMAAQDRFDPGMNRPFIGSDGRAYVTVFKGGDPKKKDSWSTLPLNVNATLRRDEWKQLDEAILMIAETRLNGIKHLIDKGLTYNLGDGLATTVLEWHDVGDAMEAELTMDAVTRSRGDRPNFQYNYLPIPILHADYEINERALRASRKLGNPLDTIGAERAARKVNEKLENMLFTNTDYAFGTKDERNRNKIYSYINHPDRITGSLSQNWDNSALSPSTIINDVRAMKQASINAHFYGPWALYVPTGYETVLDDDYDATTPGTTIRERVLKIAGIDEIKVIDTLPANNVLLVQMTQDVVRLVQGLALTNVQWSTEGGMVNKYKVMTIQVPQIRSDQNGNTGVVHYS